MVRFCNIGKDFGSITLIFGVAKTGAMDKSIWIRATVMTQKWLISSLPMFLTIHMHNIITDDMNISSHSLKRKSYY